MDLIIAKNYTTEGNNKELCSINIVLDEKSKSKTNYLNNVNLGVWLAGEFMKHDISFDGKTNLTMTSGHDQKWKRVGIQLSE